MRPCSSFLLFVIAVLGATADVAGQAAAAPAPAVPTPGQAAVPAPPQPVEASAYTYQADGRRDPFLTLIGAGTPEPLFPDQRPDGAGGLAVSEVSVRGVLKSKNAYVAMVQGPDNKTYVIHQGDKLLDGTVKSVTAQGLVIVQDVNDPLSLVKQREVRKLLRSQEDTK
jgi:Tfp pilus assembly protein PilP